MSSNFSTIATLSNEDFINTIKLHKTDYEKMMM